MGWWELGVTSPGKCVSWSNRQETLHYQQFYAWRKSHLSQQIHSILCWRIFLWVQKHLHFFKLYCHWDLSMNIKIFMIFFVKKANTWTNIYRRFLCICTCTCLTESLRNERNIQRKNNSIKDNVEILTPCTCAYCATSYGTCSGLHIVLGIYMQVYRHMLLI